MISSGQVTLFIKSVFSIVRFWETKIMFILSWLFCWKNIFVQKEPWNLNFAPGARATNFQLFSWTWTLLKLSEHIFHAEHFTVFYRFSVARLVLELFTFEYTKILQNLYFQDINIISIMGSNGIVSYIKI